MFVPYFMVSNIVTGRNVVVVVVVVVLVGGGGGGGGAVEDVVGNVNRTNRADWYVSWFGWWYVIDASSSVFWVVATVVPLDVFLFGWHVFRVVVVVVVAVGIDLEEEDDDDGGNTNNA